MSELMRELLAETTVSIPEPARPILARMQQTREAAEHLLRKIDDDQMTFLQGIAWGAGHGKVVRLENTSIICEGEVTNAIVDGDKTP